MDRRWSRLGGDPVSKRPCLTWNQCYKCHNLKKYQNLLL
jgi:hypothetical protein